MRVVTREQRLALKRIYDRQARETVGISYRQFRARAFWSPFDECLMIKWCGMLLGIEKDGYTHS